MCYEFGQGIPQNYREARRLWQLSAAQDPTKRTRQEALARIDKKICNECPLLGKRVVITGTSREDMNGKIGMATSFDHARGRYVVVFMDKQGGREVALVPKHLRRSGAG